MIELKINAKQTDAVLCMIEFFRNNDDGFLTREHGRFHATELLELDKLLRSESA